MAIEIYNLCDFETTEDTKCTEHFYHSLCPSVHSVVKYLNDSSPPLTLTFHRAQLDELGTDAGGDCGFQIIIFKQHISYGYVPFFVKIIYRPYHDAQIPEELYFHFLY